MFENTERTELSALGEFGLISHLSKHFTSKNESTVLGIGDDAAVLDFKDKKVKKSEDSTETSTTEAPAANCAPGCACH